jgi:hypothetical protein
MIYNILEIFVLKNMNFEFFLLQTSFFILFNKDNKKYCLFFRIKINYYLKICNLDLKLIISIHKRAVNYIIN